MKQTWCIGISAAAMLAAASALIAVAAGAWREEEERSRALEAAAAELGRRLEVVESGRAATESRIASLEDRIETLSAERLADAGLPAEGGRSDPGPGADLSPGPDGRPAGSNDEGKAAEAEAHPELEGLLGKLLDPSSSGRRKDEAWREAAKLGLIDDVMKAFERRAAESPGDARAQADLGVAYLQKLNGVSEMEKGSWALRADRAFDAALAIDPAHWEARFTKALALSYWPAITGKQPESIRQFETLITQQESAPARPEHAQSYLYLGNLYHGQGKSDKALEVWRRGASLFPQDEELSARIEGASRD
jgi:tetratricopeptide (TPR) repeat protein